ncbi:hypothetical protein [Arthrobacter celericrescens]|uniref:hypothetical protein n=1 Tax=Arthrobacter celericrescens TaxID=2320851 RepID=UPI002478AC13|nr:hypothetical protein [Arthrobacter celericrescens]
MNSWPTRWSKLNAASRRSGVAGTGLAVGRGFGAADGVGVPVGRGVSAGVVTEADADDGGAAAGLDAVDSARDG